MSLFCSMSRVAGWCLLKRLLRMQTCFTYTYLKKVFRKLEKHQRWDLFFESCWITKHDLLKVVKFNRNLQKMLIAALKDKKKLPRGYGRKSAFQTIAIELYKQTKTKKEHTRLVIDFIGVDVLAKIVDEFYILIKIYSYFSFVFSVVSKKVELLKISKVM